MKKLLSIILFILPAVLFALDGSGTSGDPYYGTISSDVTWDPDSYTDAKIYIGTSSNPDLTIGAGGHLTIWPGATIIFTQTTTDLIITGTGRITADAVSTNKITFTKATGNNNWGHISFQSMGSAGASVFDNCVIEYGDVSGQSGVNSYGGAIHTDFSNLTISYCSIKNNKAAWGGGIFINKTRTPSISNCIIDNNEAVSGGGGFYFWNDSKSIVSNCIISNNSTTSASYGGGGMFIGPSTDTTKISNCTFVNNSTNGSGDNIYFYNSGKSRIRNTIFWGTDNSLYLYGTTSSVLINCAIQGSTTGTNTINLNASNSASNGPNFNATDGTDWSIKFISPCRDTGTDSGAPTTDYDGESRIGTTDIGAYEVQYSRWDGSSGTSWSTDANWEEDINPGSSSSDVIIPSGLSNYPTTTGTNFTISSGYELIVEPGAKATFNILTNSSGTFRFKSDATGIASVILSNSYSDSGTEDFEMFVTGGGNPNYKWHYIAVPGSMSKTAFTNVNAYNLLLWDDSKIVDDKMQGWQWHDGYDGTTSFTTLNTKKGYNFYHSEDVTVSLASVSGLLSSMGSSVSLQYNGDGLNLLGNSLSCSINWDEVSLTGNMRDAIYFTKDNSMVSYVNGVGSPGGTTGIIPPLQGFFVKALETNCSVDFSGTNVNTHGTINRYKSKSIIPLIRFELQKDSEIKDETVIRFDYFATDTVDNKFDATKIFAASTYSSQIYTEVNNEKYVINGLPFPYESSSVPLTIKIAEAGNYKISKTQLQGLSGYNLTLTDTYQNFSINLTDISSYSFASDAGIFTDRFVFTISTFAVGLDDLFIDDRVFNIYSYSNILNVAPLSEEWNDIKADLNIYDLTGRRVQSHPNMLWYSGDTKQIGFTQPNGIYIIEIIGGNKRVVQKISHK